MCARCWFMSVSLENTYKYVCRQPNQCLHGYQADRVSQMFMDDIQRRYVAELACGFSRREEWRCQMLSAVTTVNSGTGNTVHLYHLFPLTDQMKTSTAASTKVLMKSASNLMGRLEATCVCTAPILVARYTYCHFSPLKTESDFRCAFPRIRMSDLQETLRT